MKTTRQQFGSQCCFAGRSLVARRRPVALRQEMPVARFTRWVDWMLFGRSANPVAERQGDVGRQGYVRQVHAERTGATLTEVLMSMLIMSIGVVQVMTIFPLATLRTLEANKQTNSTITRFNAEALADVDPQFIHNSDGVFPPGGPDMTPYNGLTFRGQNYFVDPLGYQEFNYDPANPTIPLAAGTLVPPTPAVSPPPPPRDTFGNFYGTVTTASVVNWALPRRYTGATLFANVLPTQYPVTAADLIAARIRAAELATQPDNWKLVTEAQITATTTTTVSGVTGITGVTMDTEADLSSINLASTTVAYRAVIYDIDGNHSETRSLYNVNAAALTLDWVPATGTPQLLPTRFDVSATGATPNVGKIRIEQAERAYTWMLSVRKRPSGSCNVDVVVFYKRKYEPSVEQVFNAEFRKWKWAGGKNDFDGALADRAPGISGGDDNGNGVNDDVGEYGYPILSTSPGYAQREEPNAIVTLRIPSTTPEEERPKPRKGGYIYETKNGLWYRIRSVQNEQYGVPSVPAGGPVEDWVDVVLDETVKLDSTEDLDASGTLNLPGEDRNGDGAVTRGGAILHPNVVNVFPLEIKEP